MELEPPTRPWPEAVERVAAFLRAAGAEARIEEFSGGTPTADAAAQAIGVEPGRIVKSLVLDCDGRAVVALVPGDRRADPTKIAAAAGGACARVARADEVEAATGFVPGAVAPFPLRDVGRVFVDRSLLVHDVVWVGAGSPCHMAGLTPAELVRLSHAEAIDALEDG